MADKLGINYGGNMVVVLQIASHILNPCVDPKTGRNIKGFYIREAEDLLKRVDAEGPAYMFLRMVIDDYRDNKEITNNTLTSSV